MTTLTLTYKLINKKIKSVSTPVISWKLMVIMGVFLCLALFIFYIILINQLTLGTYLVKNYNQEIAKLSKENRAIEADFMETGFLDQIHGKANQLGFEKTSQVKYVKILHSTFTAAR